MDEDDNIVEFKKPMPDETDEDLDPDIILEGAKGRLDTALLAGYTKSGSFYLALSQASVPENIILVEIAKRILVDHLVMELDLND